MSRHGYRVLTADSSRESGISLRLAVLSGLALPDDDANEALAVQAARGPCAASLEPHIRSGMGDGSALFKKNATALLAKSKAKNSSDKK